MRPSLQEAVSQNQRASWMCFFKLTPPGPVQGTSPGESLQASTRDILSPSLLSCFCCTFKILFPGPWPVWLSGLNAGLQTKGSIPNGAHAWVAGQVPSCGCTRGNHTLMFLSSFSPLLFLKIKYLKIYIYVPSFSYVLVPRVHIPFSSNVNTFPVLEQWAFTEEEHQGQFNLLGMSFTPQSSSRVGKQRRLGQIHFFYTAHKLRMFLTNEFLQPI